MVTVLSSRSGVNQRAPFAGVASLEAEFELALDHRSARDDRIEEPDIGLLVGSQCGHRAEREDGQQRAGIAHEISSMPERVRRPCWLAPKEEGSGLAGSGYFVRISLSALVM